LAEKWNQVFVDTTHYQGIDAYCDSWEIGDLTADYGAAPTALIVNENVVHFSVNAGASIGAPPTLTFDEPLDRNAVDVRIDATTVSNVVAGYELRVVNRPFVGGLVLSGEIAIGSGSQHFAVAVPNASLRFGTVLANAIGSSASLAVERRCSGVGATVATIRSRPLLELINHCLLVSDNLYAESLYDSSMVVV
jgi:D-alanyl-D-alanine carboxypeptidase